MKKNDIKAKRYSSIEYCIQLTASYKRSARCERNFDLMLALNTYFHGKYSIYLYHRGKSAISIVF